MQRISELIVARRNEMRIKCLGGYEVGKEHYKWIVLLHSLFFLSLLFEVIGLQKSIVKWWVLPGILLFSIQLLRVWTIRSLGMYWNTKIMILPGATPISKGPYRWIRHPNYFIVITELLLLPLMFQAYATALIFTLLNLYIILRIRIPAEEKALMEATTYQEKLGSKHRFIPH